MKNNKSQVEGGYVLLDGDEYFRISNAHLMPEFFMSLVGASDHWMFVSSLGALTAGRRNADNALFPYAPDDQISAFRATTGPITLIRVAGVSEPASSSQHALWHPFSPRAAALRQCRQNIFKTPLGNKLVFEECNDALELSFRYRWTFSEQYGFIRSCRLQNNGRERRSLEMLDGLQNVLPYGVGNEFVSRFSNLSNAYKKNELLDSSQIALFYLSSIPTDRAEPSEGLMATSIWQTGLEPEAILLSTEQIKTFHSGKAVHTQADIRGRAGAFAACQQLDLEPGESVEWHIVAEVLQDHSDVAELDNWIQSTQNPLVELNADIEASERDFLHIVSSSDGIQHGANRRRTARHLGNTVFNVMRGGIPRADYLVPAHDYTRHIAHFNREIFKRHRTLLESMPAEQDIASLQSTVQAAGDADLTRLSIEYLPLAFSRRHGDPTRPWNQFSIDLRAPNGRKNLSYQGNWRDIFQNWEALAFSFPEFLTGMVCRFLNATTADGYNPYRLTQDGFEWETPSPDDPWANIGYWGDHQIIYLLKLLEWSHRFQPQHLVTLLNEPIFVHANVPYRINDFEQIKQNPRSTIEFDEELATLIEQRVQQTGGDGKLLRDQHDNIHHVTLIEKLLILSLTKLSNLIPDGGIWLNTQRPEWNDANNALVGRGLSMVTACYLYRWFSFLLDWIENVAIESFTVSQEVADFFYNINAILSNNPPSATGEIDAQQRAEIVAALSAAGSNYRNRLYHEAVSGDHVDVAKQQCQALFEAARDHLERTIRNNRRHDKLYHTYNLLDWNDDGLNIKHLYEMLEGQVAVLSSGLLSAEDGVELLDALRGSALYRENQKSYLLYPDRQLPRFMEKNQVPADYVASNDLLLALLNNDDSSIVHRDVHGAVHFNGGFRNSADLEAALESLGAEYTDLVGLNKVALARKFDELFGHDEFTGRSGTFFAYEGLGSIYWHMVSKLGLAVSENIFWAATNDAAANTIDSLRDQFAFIRDGIGAEKSPQDYGAFPSDPYSHTPENAGVKQPGMTGQVKED
ncbi:MAG: hypothetical protein KJP04_03625, partial [Arenicella sp.]|nr:hypothetical protein [Arenicella sp.]